MNTQIAGHQHIISLLERSLQQRHAHAFLFIGAEHIGKTTVSDLIINKLIPKQFLQFNLFDLCREEDKMIISIDQIIEMQKNVTLKPANNFPVVVRIHQPELLSPEAANRILKILEEPPEYVIFILISISEDSILPTIKSRCQKINFEQVDDQDIKNFVLDTRGALPDNFDAILSFAHGCPGKVIRAIESPEYIQGHLDDLEKIIALVDSPTQQQLSVIQDWFLSNGSYIEKKEKLKHTINLLEELLHAIIAIQYRQKSFFSSELNNISKKVSHKKMLNLFEASMRYRHRLSFNPDIRTIVSDITLLNYQ